MGLRLEVYNDNFVGLVADFSYTTPSSYFIPTDSVSQAIKYFDLYIDESTARLKRNDPNQKVVDKLGITIDNVDDFIADLENISDTLTDEQAIANPLLVVLWKPNKVYSTGTKVRYENIVWKTIEEHTSSLENAPFTEGSLWQQLSDMPEEEMEEDPQKILDNILGEEGNE